MAAGPADERGHGVRLLRRRRLRRHVSTLVIGQDPLGQPIAASPRFEARPSACYDAKGRLWIAYEEGPEKWGKDFGALAGRRQPALQRPRRPRGLPGGRQADGAGRRAAAARRQSAQAGVGQAGQLRKGPALQQPAARPGRQGPALADLPPEVRHALQHPPRLLLADLRPPAGRRPLDRPDRGGPLRRPARRDGRGAAAPVRRRRHRPQHRRPLHDAEQDPEHGLCQLSRSARRSGRAEVAAARPRQEGRRRRQGREGGREAHPRLPHRGGRQEVPAAARRLPPAHGDFLGRRPGRLAGGLLPLLHRRGGVRLDGQHRPRQRRRPRVPLVADAEGHRRLFRRRPFHAGVRLRAERGLPARPPQRHVRPSRRADAAAAGGRRQTSRWPGSAPTTPRCFTDT